ncbi:MAG: hypothetical protein R3260_20060 [Pseudomonas sp.]|nr:hypothetical protein [Pseudomonas sp.]
MDSDNDLSVGQATIKLLEKETTEDKSGSHSGLASFAVYEYPLRQQFWNDLIQGNAGKAEEYTYQYQGDLLRQSLNMYWGKQ